ncbi:beta strand repeat-containing protein, partial [Hydrogenophaga palleronii]|uniref:beta strand repeat-containing protein n=1 Tax=Hydrogenophaga palleronii TaxID=65655 RepID=UPI000A905BAD
TLNNNGGGTLNNNGTLNNAGTLNNYVGGTLNNNGTLTGNIANNGRLVNTGSLSGNISNEAGGVVEFDTTNAALNYSHVISGQGSVVVRGNNTTTFTGVNTYSGGTRINAGTLALSGSGSLAGTGALNLESAARLDLSGSDVHQTIGALSGVTGSTIDLGARSLTFGDGTNQTFAGVIRGSGGLVYRGGGTTSLTGSNTYTGGTTINAGTLAIDNTQALGTGTVTLNDGAELLGTSTLTHSHGLIVTSGRISAASNQIFTVSGNLSAGPAGTLHIGSSGNTGTVRLSTGLLAVASPVDVFVDHGTLQFDANGGRLGRSGGSLTIQAGATADLNGSMFEASHLRGAGLFTNQASRRGLVSVGWDSTANSIFAGTIEDGTGGIRLQKSGSHTLTLSGSNTYTGGTRIDAGTLALSGAGSLAGTGAVALTSSTAGFDISGADGNRTIGALSGAAGSTVTLGAHTLTFGDDTNQSFDGVIGGTGGVVKQGSGTTTFTAANTYSGDTTVNAGTLAIGNMAALGTSRVSLNNGAELLSTVSSSLGSGRLRFTDGRISAADEQTFAVSVAFLRPGTLRIGSAGHAGTVQLATEYFSVPMDVHVEHGTLRYGGFNGLSQTLSSSAGWLNVHAGARADLNGSTVEASHLRGDGLITNSGLPQAAAAVVDVGWRSRADSLFAGTIEDGTGGISLQKRGSDTLTLSGTSTYTGGTTINAGRLVLDGAGSLHAQGAVALTGAARFDISSATGDRTIGALSGVTGSSIALGAR